MTRDCILSQLVHCCLQIYILVMVLVKDSQASIPALGNCSNKLPADPIDIRKLTGVWYVSERWSSLKEWPFKCASIKISKFFEMQSELTYSCVNRYSGKREEDITFPLRAASDANDGKLVFGPVEFDSKPRTSSVQVINTDYNDWSVVWSCNPYLGANAHSEMVWVLTRQREPSDETLSKIEATLTTYHLENKRLYEVAQTGCDNQNNKTSRDY